MKRILLALALIILAAAFLLARVGLPHLSSVLLSSALKAEIKVQSAKLGFEKGLFRLSLRGVSVKGGIEGHVGGLDSSFLVSFRPSIKDITLLDFDLTIKDLRGRTPLLPPFDRLELKKGYVRYNDYRIFVQDFAVRKETKGLAFEGRLTGEGLFDTLTLTGTFREKTHVSAKVNLTSLSLGSLLKTVKGSCDLEGLLISKEKTISFKGIAKGRHVRLEYGFLRRPLLYPNLHGLLELTLSKDGFLVCLSSVNLSPASPFSLEFRGKFGHSTTVRLSSGTFPFEELKKKVDLDRLIGTGFSDHLRGGEISIESLETRDGTWRARAGLYGLTISYGNLTFEAVRAKVEIDRDLLRIEDLEGKVGRSEFRRVIGRFSLDGKALLLSAHYRVDLRDLPSLLDTKDLRFKGGQTSGVLEARKGQKGLEYVARGTIEGGEASWRKIDFRARGNYVLNEREITFDPLVLYKGSSELTLRGSWKKDAIKFQINGGVESKDLSFLYPAPLQFGGQLKLDSALFEKNGSVYSLKGTFDLTDTSILVADLFRKVEGVGSKARLDASWEGKVLNVRCLSLRTDSSELHIRGTLKGQSEFDGQVFLSLRNARDLEILSELFTISGGAIEANLSVKDLRRPLQRLPKLEGKVELNGVKLLLPSLPNALSNLSLFADLEGDHLSFELRSLNCGGTVVKRGMLTITRLDAPLFSLSLQLKSFLLKDFLMPGGALRFPVIGKDSYLSRSKGRLRAEVEKADLLILKGEKFVIDGLLEGGRLVVPQISLQLFQGSGHISAFLDLSREVPEATIWGNLRDVELKELLGFLRASSSQIEGKAEVSFRLSASGTDTHEMGRGLNGTVSFSGKDGTIKKWTLLSKVFALLNLYDLLRGRVDLRKEGLPYRRICGTFQVESGRLSTKDFFIDSPSMLIKGEGSFDLKSGRMEGDLVISPFVAIDKAIEKLPIVRHILRERRKGFLHATLRIEGPTADPHVRVRALQTVTGSFIDALRRLITFPRSEE